MEDPCRQVPDEPLRGRVSRLHGSHLVSSPSGRAPGLRSRLCAKASRLLKHPWSSHVASIPRRDHRRSADRHRHALGRRRHEPLRARAVHRRLLVLRRAAARGLHAPRPRRAARDRRRVGAGSPTSAPIDAYLAAVDVRGAIAASPRRAGDRRAAGRLPRRPRPLLRGDVGPGAWRSLGKGEPVPYERCVRASTGAARAVRIRTPKRERVAGAAGARRAIPSPRRRGAARRGRRLARGRGSCRWHRSARSARPSSPQLDALAARQPPAAPARPSCATCRGRTSAFLPIEDAWFSGSMNYLGRARRPDGSPGVRGDLRDQRLARDLRCPSSQQLVSHEVVPGPRDDLRLPAEPLRAGQARLRGDGPDDEHARRRRSSKGIANNAILMAHGVTEVGRAARRGPADRRAARAAAGRREEPVVVPDVERKAGRRTRSPRVLRHDYLVSDERADKLSGAWGRHPLLGRMYLPAYRAGTELVAVAELRIAATHPSACCRRSMAAPAWWIRSRCRRFSEVPVVGSVGFGSAKSDGSEPPAPGLPAAATSAATASARRATATAACARSGRGRG